MAQMHRRLGLLNATTINMSNMVGIGPFIAIALILKTLAGPQAYLAWVVGTVIALADGMVGGRARRGQARCRRHIRVSAGGLRPAHVGPHAGLPVRVAGSLRRTARDRERQLGLVQYLRVFLPDLSELDGKLLAAGICALLVVALYRRIDDIAKLMFVLWSVMLLTTGWVIVTGILHFDPALAFDLPENAFRFDLGFLARLGEGSAEVLYLFLGYYQVCYLGGEIRDPGRTIPRAVLYSILAVAAIDIAISFSFIGVVPWREAMESRPRCPVRGARVRGMGRESAGGHDRGHRFRVDLRADAGLFPGALRCGPRRRLLPPARRVASDQGVPARSLLLVGAGAICASFFSLDHVIKALMAARILIQFLGNTFALFLIRSRRPDIARPFSMWGYPLPAILSIVGYI